MADGKRKAAEMTTRATCGACGREFDVCSRGRIRPHVNMSPDARQPLFPSKAHRRHPRCDGSWSVAETAPAMREALVRVGYLLATA